MLDALKIASLVVLGLIAGTPASGLDDPDATVLYLDRTVEIETTLADPTDLWIPASELPRVNDFVLKPEGACLDDLCIPVAGDALVVEREGERWFSLTGFAEKIGQSVVADGERSVWSFGTIPAVHAPFRERGVAPDFVLENRAGEEVRLSDFRGHKVLLLTWASW